MKWARIFFACLWIMAIAASASAAVSQNLVVTAQTPQAPKANIVNGSNTVNLTTTTNYVTLTTGGANGSYVSSIICTSNDATASHNIVLAEEKAGALTTLLPLGVYNIAIASATAVTTTNGNLIGTTALPGLAQDSDGNPVFPLNNGDVLVVGVLTTAVTSPDQITCFAKQADF